MRLAPAAAVLLALGASASIDDKTPAQRAEIRTRGAAACDSAAGQRTALAEACRTRRIIAEAARTRADLENALTAISEVIAQNTLLSSARAKGVCASRRREGTPPEPDAIVKVRKQLLESCDVLEHAEADAREYSDETPLSVEYYDNLAAVWVADSAITTSDSALRSASR